MSISNNFNYSVNKAKLDLDTDNPSGRDKGIKSLGRALQSGNLDRAQTIFNNLQTQAKSHKGHRLANGATTPVPSEIENDVKALGTALKAGDLAGAQKAFGKLQDEFKNDHKAPIQFKNDHRAPVQFKNDHRAPVQISKDDIALPVPHGDPMVLPQRSDDSGLTMLTPTPSATGGAKGILNISA